LSSLIESVLDVQHLGHLPVIKVRGIAHDIVFVDLSLAAAAALGQGFDVGAGDLLVLGDLIQRRAVSRIVGARRL